MRINLDKKLLNCKLKINIHDPKKDIGVSRYLNDNKVWEPFETKIFLDLIKNKSFFLDIGANIGYYSLIASRQMADDSKIMSFEPDDKNFKLLTKNIKENKATKIIKYKLACSDKIGFSALKKSKDNLGDHRLENSQNVKFKKIKTTTVDTISQNEKKKPDIIKIDTQGAEVLIMKGMKNWLSQFSNETVLIFEFWPYGLFQQNHTIKNLISLFKNHSFNYFAIFEETSTFIQCDLDDLERWSKSIMNIKSKSYTNILVSHPNSKIIKKLKKKYLNFDNKFELNKIYSAVRNKKIHRNIIPVGWSFPDNKGLWNNGNYSEIIIKKNKLFDEKNKKYFLYLKIHPFLNSKLNKVLKILVKMNGIETKLIKLNKMNFYDFHIEIPKKVVKKNMPKLIISFKYFDLLSPFEVDRSNDNRKLSMFLNKFGILDNNVYFSKR